MILQADWSSVETMKPPIDQLETTQTSAALGGLATSVMGAHTHTSSDS